MKRIQDLLHDDVRSHILGSKAGFVDIVSEDGDTIFIVCCWKVSSNTV